MTPLEQTRARIRRRNRIREAFVLFAFVASALAVCGLVALVAEAVR